MPPLPRHRLKLTDLPDGRSDARERRVPCLVASRLQLFGPVPGDAVRLFAVLANEQGCGGVEVSVGDGQRLGRILLLAAAFASGVLLPANHLHEAGDDHDIGNDDGQPRPRADKDKPTVLVGEHIPEIDKIECGNTDDHENGAL